MARTLFRLQRLTYSTMADFYAECIDSNGVYKFYKSGEWLESGSGKTVKILNPSTNAAVFEVQGTSFIKAILKCVALPICSSLPALGGGYVVKITPEPRFWASTQEITYIDLFL